MLDAQTCYQALISRDRRHDGRFFVGVTSTRIYCRPVCPARTPRRDRCRFFETALAAEAAGFVPCLRCRPDRAPGNAPMDAKSGLARRAARLLAANLEVGVEALATRLGVSARHMRRALRDELGVTPVGLRQAQRVALARQLVLETNLPLTRVALASGFGSLRSFNAAFRRRVGRAPSSLRAARGNR